MNQTLKSFLKFWVPYGILNVYRKQRSTEVESLNHPLLLPVRPLEELLPGIEAVPLEILAGQVRREPDMFLPLVESLVISSICKYIQPKRIFEIGTFTGLTTLQMAMNTSETTEIFTLDLNPEEDFSTLQAGSFVGSYYRGTVEERRIRQLYGDSRTIDLTQYYDTCDLVFIDANHTYEFVKSDSERAFQLLRQDGIIIWDDYIWTERHPECAGVAYYLNELVQSKACYCIAGTRLAIFRDGS